MESPRLLGPRAVTVPGLALFLLTLAVWGTTGQAFCRMSSYWNLCDVFLSSPGAVGLGRRPAGLRRPSPHVLSARCWPWSPGRAVPVRLPCGLRPPHSVLCEGRSRGTAHSQTWERGNAGAFFFFPPIFFWTMSTFKNVYVAEFINIFLCGAWIFDSWLETLRSYAELLVCFLVPMVSHFTINV